MKPTVTQQKARIIIAMYAMSRALDWFDPSYFGEEPVFADMLWRIHCCFARCEIWAALQDIQPANNISWRLIEKAEDLFDKRYMWVKKTTGQRVAVNAAAYLEAASMALNDCLKTCPDFQYRPMTWLYRCSQKVLSWLYALFDEDLIYETGATWYFDIMDKIGRK